MTKISNTQLAQDVVLQRRVRRAGSHYRKLLKEKGPQDSTTKAAEEEYRKLRRQLVGQAADYIS